MFYVCLYLPKATPTWGGHIAFSPRNLFARFERPPAMLLCCASDCVQVHAYLSVVAACSAEHNAVTPGLLSEGEYHFKHGLSA